MFLDPARDLFVLVAVIFLGWFALGTQLNVRKGNQVLRWLREGLSLVGEKTTLRWLGSSAIELKVASARGALRKAEIFVLLEPRDVPFLWWFYRALGRHDLLIVRGQLQAMPPFELEALDPRAWATRRLRRELRAKHWVRLGTPTNSHLLAYADGEVRAASELLGLAALSELSLVRFAVRRAVPNLELQWRLRGFRALPAGRLFETVQQIAGRL